MKYESVFKQVKDSMIKWISEFDNLKIVMEKQWCELQWKNQIFFKHCTEKELVKDVFPQIYQS